MKNKILIFIMTLTLSGIVTSCDILDLDPTKNFTEELVWESQTQADKWVTGFYAMLRDHAEINVKTGKKSIFSDSYSDIFKSANWEQYEHSNPTLLEDGYLKSNGAGPFETWTKEHYGRIRRCNEFLWDAPRDGMHLGDDFIKTRMGEVRFIRAYGYYLLARVYGGVVIRTEEGGLDSEPEAHKARSTEQETWEFIVRELKAAAADLPAKWPAEWRGRITKGAAYAFLTRCALYAQDWDSVIEAAEEVRKLGYDLHDSYAGLYSDIDNQEIILAVEFGTGLTHMFDRYFRSKGDNAENYAVGMPTGDIVDSYEWAGGGKFDWADWENNTATYGNNPYTNREPRFHASIIYHGATFNGHTYNMMSGPDVYVKFERNKTLTSTVTGYYLKKWLQEDNANYLSTYSNQYWIFIRYAEVLLNKAEALARKNYGSNSTAALDALNEVRDRVGLPDVSAASLEDFMELLREEKKVELAFEGHRFWDLKRWKLARAVIDGKQAAAHVPYMNGNDVRYQWASADGDNFRIFQERYYYPSIPEEERNKNPLIVNNTGW